MKIEVKSVKHAAFASQETMCFTADLYVNGTKLGSVRNEGCGGANIFEVYGREVRAVMDEADAYCKTLPKVSNEFDSEHPLSMDLEFFVTLLVSREVAKKELRNLLKSKIVIQKPSDPETYTVKLKPGFKPTEDLCKKYQEQNPGITVMNLLPFEVALNRYEKETYEPLIHA